MAMPSSQDQPGWRHADDMARTRKARAAAILKLASCQHPGKILAYGLANPSFTLADCAAKFGLTVNKLYPTMGRMIKLGMVCKLHLGRGVVAYELTYEGRLVAVCLSELARTAPRPSLPEEE